MTDFSISVILVVKDSAEYLKKTLRVWGLECSSYKWGSELIIVDYSSSDHTSEVVNSFMDANQDTPLRIVYAVLDEGDDLSEYMASYVHSPYVLFAQNGEYPGMHILQDLSEELDPSVVQVSMLKRIKEPFNYSRIIDDDRRNNPDFWYIEKSKKQTEFLTFSGTLVPVSLFLEFPFRGDLDLSLREACSSRRSTQGLEFKCIGTSFLFQVGK